MHKPLSYLSSLYIKYLVYIEIHRWYGWTGPALTIRKFGGRKTGISRSVAWPWRYTAATFEAIPGYQAIQTIWETGHAIFAMSEILPPEGAWLWCTSVPNPTARALGSRRVGASQGTQGLLDGCWRAFGRLLWVTGAEGSFFLVAPKTVHAGARLSSAAPFKALKGPLRGDWGARDNLLSKSHRSVLRDDGSERIHPLLGKPATHQCVQWLPLEQRAEKLPLLVQCAPLHF